MNMHTDVWLRLYAPSYHLGVQRFQNSQIHLVNGLRFVLYTPTFKTLLNLFFSIYGTFDFVIHTHIFENTDI